MFVASAAWHCKVFPSKVHTLGGAQVGVVLKDHGEGNVDTVLHEGEGRRIQHELLRHGEAHVARFHLSPSSQCLLGLGIGQERLCRALASEELQAVHKVCARAGLCLSVLGEEDEVGRDAPVQVVLVQFYIPSSCPGLEIRYVVVVAGEGSLGHLLATGAAVRGHPDRSSLRPACNGTRQAWDVEACEVLKDDGVRPDAAADPSELVLTEVICLRSASGSRRSVSLSSTRRLFEAIEEFCSLEAARVPRALMGHTRESCRAQASQSS